MDKCVCVWGEGSGPWASMSLAVMVPPGEERRRALMCRQRLQNRCPRCHACRVVMCITNEHTLETPGICKRRRRRRRRREGFAKDLGKKKTQPKTPTRTWCVSTIDHAGVNKRAHGAHFAVAGFLKALKDRAVSRSGHDGALGGFVRVHQTRDT